MLYLCLILCYNLLDFHKIARHLYVCLSVSLVRYLSIISYAIRFLWSSVSWCLIIMGITCPSLKSCSATIHNFRWLNQRFTMPDQFRVVYVKWMCCLLKSKSFVLLFKQTKVMLNRIQNWRVGDIVDEFNTFFFVGWPTLLAPMPRCVVTE